ncbi:hypothetical protein YASMINEVIRUS_1595 [Yasminevirus sp. GU-2018]|uniref:Type III polyketide synthase n=1 Tax=Yasminevirus sp. GU-2018 TaxID=2420051 RepID=A0A5K0UBM6_9VIRU|nr:hypothetical protein YASMINEVIRUS_1595 [Yasminevirus sp. GU-2018]
MTISSLIDYELSLPDYKVDTRDQFDIVKQQMGLLGKLFIGDKKLDGVYKKIGVDSKNTCIYPGDFSQFIEKPYDEKMKFYKEEAFYLAMKTVDKLLKRCDKSKITHVLATSCTGTFAPFIQDLIVDKFGLNQSCKRTSLQYMGCHAGVKTLDLANTLASENKGNTVLCVCVELCSVHATKINMFDDKNKIMMDVLSNMLFADGCSAFLVSSDDTFTEDKTHQNMRINHTMTHGIENSKEFLTWNVGPKQFVMNMTKGILTSIKSNLMSAVDRFNQELAKKNITIDPTDVQYIVHPGGPAILSEVIKTLNLNNNALDPSFETLRKFGNMSSSTVFFVLNTYLRSCANEKRVPKSNIVMIAFGPGMTIEMVLLNTDTKNSFDNSTKYIDVDRNTFVSVLNVRSNGSNTSDKSYGRSYRREIMDRPIEYTSLYDVNDLKTVYMCFDRLYRFLFFTSAYVEQIRSYRPDSLLEIGTGSGYVANMLANKLPNTNVVSVDRNILSIDHCRSTIKQKKNLVFMHDSDNSNCNSNNPQVDVVTCSNVCHHMTDDEFVEFIGDSYKRAKKAVVIVDLEKSAVAKWLWYIPGFIMCSKLTRDDGFTSIEKAFTRDQIKFLVQKAGVPSERISINSLWPCRMMIVLDKNDDSSNSRNVSTTSTTLFGVIVQYIRYGLSIMFGTVFAVIILYYLVCLLFLVQ